MKLSVRPPAEREWRICRMLLPETFADVSGRSYLLCSDDTGALVGAASYRAAPEAVTHLRLHVIPSFRRRGVGSWLIKQLAHSGVPRLEGTSEVLRERHARAFCEHNGFRETDALTTVEGDIGPMREYLSKLRSRVAPAGSVRVLPLAEAPTDQVSLLHTEHIAQTGEFARWRALVAQSSEMAISPVILIGGRVAGMMLGKVEGKTAIVTSRVIAPGYHGTWVNAILIAAALDTAWLAGARRARFSYTNANGDTQKLAARFEAATVSVSAVFERRAEAGGTRCSAPSLRA